MCLALGAEGQLYETLIADRDRQRNERMAEEARMRLMGVDPAKAKKKARKK